MELNVILACHNRRALTLASIGSLFSSADRARTAVQVTLYDDGSSDGTASAVQEKYPHVKVLHGDGSAFWAKSMALAEGQVIGSDSLSDEDYIMWVNDDVVLDVDALERLVAVSAIHRDAVLAGAVRDPGTGAVTYTGFQRRGLHPLRLTAVPPTQVEQAIDTFNGNLLVVPAHIARTLGGIDGGFAHALADIDYGFRCKRAGYEILLAPGTYGTCSRNAEPPAEGLMKSWRRYRGPKGGGHFQSMRRILQKESPTLWPLYICSSYFLWWLRHGMRALRRRSR